MTESRGTGSVALSVKGVCLNDSGEVLLCLNGRDEWELPGGRPERGEAFPCCLEREIAEESGLRVEVAALIGASSALEVLPGRWVHIVAYGCRLLAACDVVVSAEHQAVRFFAAEDLPGLRLAGVYRAAIEAWSSRAGSDCTNDRTDAEGDRLIEDRLQDLSLALELAAVADDLALAAFRGAELTVDSKADGSPVSDADLTIERALREHLARVRPDHRVIGEEGAGSTGGGWCWYLDPIDGTSRFIAGDPRWYTLIALALEETVMVAVASAPALGIRWWAVRGVGAFCNGQRMAVSEIRTLAEATINDDWRETLRRGVHDRPLAKIARRCARIRSHDGHSYLAVAQGKGDVAAGTGGGPWDYAAIKLIVEEAGGRFTDLEGHDSFKNGSAVVSNGRVHDEALAELNPPEPPEADTRRSPAAGASTSDIKQSESSSSADAGQDREAKIVAVAVELACRAHDGQRYPSPEREPFIEHPLRVMNAVHGAHARAAAVLHDVLEDTAVTADELRAAELPVEVVEAVIALTRRPTDAYEQYIERVARNDIAREVKLADLSDNLANNRRLPKDPDVSARIDRYERALRRLKPGNVPRTFPRGSTCFGSRASPSPTDWTAPAQRGKRARPTGISSISASTRGARLPGTEIPVDDHRSTRHWTVGSSSATVSDMAVIPQKELRNNVGEVLRRAEAGEEITITVAGREVARLGPTGRRHWVSGSTLRAIWQTPAPRTLAGDLERFPGALTDPFS